MPLKDVARGGRLWALEVAMAGLCMLVCGEELLGGNVLRVAKMSMGEELTFEVFCGRFGEGIVVFGTLTWRVRGNACEVGGRRTCALLLCGQWTKRLTGHSKETVEEDLLLLLPLLA